MSILYGSQAKEVFLVEQVYPSFAKTMTKHRDSIKRYLPHTVYYQPLMKGEQVES